MQRPDEKKRKLIVATAAKLFAERPFHKVRLDDIAAAARIGKGTLYVYFDTKEELYLSLMTDGFTRLLESLERQIDEPSADGERPDAPAALRRTVDALVAFAFAHPHLHEMMRNVGEIKQLGGRNWTRLRTTFLSLVARCIRRGIAAGELNDPNPEMTAACVGGMVRSIVLFGPKGLSEKQVADQVYRILSRGIFSSRTLLAGGKKR